MDKELLLEESTKTYKQLKEVGIKAEMVVLDGEGHFFEYGREEESGVQETLDGISSFLIEELGC